MKIYLRRRPPLKDSKIQPPNQWICDYVALLKPLD